MALIRPFKALRPAQEAASMVASVPYDVVNTKEAKELAEGNPFSLLRVTRSEIELPEGTNPYSDEVYQKAKDNLKKIKTEAPLIVEDEAKIYIYKLVMDGREQTGLAATFAVDDYDSGVIMKHEKTRKEKEDDRTKHIITTEAQTGPVFLTYKGVEAVNGVVNDTMKNTEPLYKFTSVDGISHTVWSVPADKTAVIVAEIAKVEKLYIADGHHRAASAARARTVKKEANSRHAGGEEYNYFLAVLFPAEQLKILPYNRVVFDLNGRTGEEFINEIAEKFEVTQSDEKTPAKPKTFSMYLGGKWYSLKTRDSVLASASLSDSVAGHLDVSILQDFLLNPVLGIEDPRTSKRIDFVGGIRGTGELEKLVDSGKAVAAFSLYPVSVYDLMGISDAGEIMPPKSTWFEPKLRDGLLVHLI